MRFHSTPQSALDGEITILAIIETIVSIAIYVGIGLYFGTFKYLAWAIVVAPLMLFRTEDSAEWGLKVYEESLDFLEKLFKHLDRQDSHGDEPNFFNRFAAAVAVPLIGITIRIAATLYWTTRRPFSALSNMSQNWMRQSCCTDFFHPPEILPNEAAKGNRGVIPKFDDVLDTFRDEDTVTKVVILPLVVIGYLPSLIYRVSFKATAIAYAPFVWVSHATLQNPLTTKLRLERFTKGELEKVRRVISLFILTILIAKIALVWGGWLEQSFIESKFPSKKLAELVVVFGNWPWWQFTLLADALLTFFLFYFADAALGRIDSPHAWKEERTLGTVSALSFLRATLALATIGHFFYIALRVVAPKSLQAFL